MLPSILRQASEPYEKEAQLTDSTNDTHSILTQVEVEAVVCIETSPFVELNTVAHYTPLANCTSARILEPTQSGATECLYDPGHAGDLRSTRIDSLEAVPV
jgi:hypothetical protein